MNIDTSRTRKERILLSLTEDDFRDTVVRPLFEKRGLRFLRDTCGPDEEGKDCLFIGKDPLNATMLYAVQTKKGPLKLSAKPRDNLAAAVVQLQTALTVQVPLTEPKCTLTPSVLILCASGKINEAARKHIASTIKDARLRFMDVNDLIPEIDELCPEYWYGVSASQFPYFRRLADTLLAANDTVSFAGPARDPSPLSPVSDENFVGVVLSRVDIQTIRKLGKTEQRPRVEHIPFSAIVRKEQRILVLGEGGSGKTTGIRRAAYEVCMRAMESKQVVLIPVMLRASALSGATENLATIAARTTAIVAGGEAAFSTEDLSAGRVAIFVDALDELPDTEREAVGKLLSEFCDAYPRSRVIVTSREYAFLNTATHLRGFARYRVFPMEVAQALRLVERVTEGRKIEKHVASEMIRRLHDIHGLSLSPLLVTVFVATADFTSKDIPPNITEIFSKFTEMMLGRWDEKKGLAQQYHFQIKDFLLRRLGITLQRAKRRALPLDECRSLFADELSRRGQSANIGVLFDEIVERSGLVHVNDGAVEFRHHLLQEYYAGRGITDAAELSSVVADDWWRNAIVFYFGDNPTASDRLNELTKVATVLSSRELYNAAITVGLAMQACYLAEVSAKDELLLWVVRNLASTYAAFLEILERNHERFPLLAFITYYIVARDAVACDQVANVLRNLAADELWGSNELEIFWCAVGLIESGNTKEAQKLLKGFRPKDQRLLLALDLGCTYIANRQVSRNDARSDAEAISKQIRPRIGHLLEEVLHELKGVILELRGGEIRAVDRLAEPMAE